MRTRFTKAQDGVSLWVESNKVVAHYRKRTAGHNATMLLLEGGHEIAVLEKPKEVQEMLDGIAL